MVTTVADTLFHRLIDAFPADRSYSVSEFSRDPMPRQLQVCLERRIGRMLDDLARPDEEWIENAPEVQEAASAYRNVLARNLRVPTAAWHGELELACRMLTSYLIRPVPTLTDLIFANGKAEATLDDISEWLRLLPSYPYFAEVIGAYFEQKDLEQISRDRFAGLARRIDREMVRDFGADEWMKLLQPLLELIRQIPEFSGGVPVEVLKTFFEEKGVDDLLSRLDARFGSQGIQLIRIAELRAFFERPEEPKVKEEVSPIAVESSGSAEKGDSNQRSGHVPLWKQFESGAHPASERGSSTASMTRGESVPSEAVEKQPLWKQFHGSTGTRTERGSEGSAGHENVAESPTDELSKLERAVLGQRGLRNRDLFLRHLFAGSEKAYEETLRKLDAADNWSDASQIIAREVFMKHQVNIYSDPAVAFTDAAEAKFRS